MSKVQDLLAGLDNEDLERLVRVIFDAGPNADTASGAVIAMVENYASSEIELAVVAAAFHLGMAAATYVPEYVQILLASLPMQAFKGEGRERCEAWAREFPLTMPVKEEHD